MILTLGFRHLWRYNGFIMEKVIIVAIADNNAIGKDNALLWHISEDLKFFKRTTSGSPVIMGRKTYESIGRPLPKRTNIVVSRGFDAPCGLKVVHSLDEAYEAASVALKASVSSGTHDEGRCFIIGGGRVYAQAINDADRLIITHVHTVIDDANTFFPDFSPSVWKVDCRSGMMTDPETGYEFEFVEYIRL